jgi:hypothetical protein
VSLRVYNIITQPGQAGCGQILLHLLTEQRTSGRPSQPPRISHNVVRARECATKTIALCKYTHTLTRRQAEERALFESEFLIVRATWCAPQIALIKSPINYAHQRPFSVAGFEHERLSSIMHRARALPAPFYAKRAHSRRRWVQLITAAPSVKVDRTLISEKSIDVFTNKEKTCWRQ